MQRLYNKKSNLVRIRQLSTNELAVLMYKLHINPCICCNKSGVTCNFNCVENISDWLLDCKDLKGAFTEITIERK